MSPTDTIERKLEEADIRLSYMSLKEADMFQMHMYNILSGEAESAKAAHSIEDVTRNRDSIVEVMRIMCEKAAAQILDESIESVPGEMYCAFPVRLSMRHQICSPDALSDCEMGLKVLLNAAIEDLCGAMEYLLDTSEEAPQPRLQVAYEIAKHSSWNVNLLPVPNAQRCLEALVDKGKRAVQQIELSSVRSRAARGGVPYTPDIHNELVTWREGLSDCWIKQHVVVGCNMAYSFASAQDDTRTQAYMLIARTPMKGVQTIHVDYSVVDHAIKNQKREEAVRLEMMEPQQQASRQADGGMGMLQQRHGHSESIGRGSRRGRRANSNGRRHKKRHGSRRRSNFNR